MKAKILNTHDQLCRSSLRVKVAIIPACMHGWCVWRPGYKTDPQSAWYDRGNKHFSDFGGKDWRENRRISLLMAIQWTAERYGFWEWTLNKFRDYVPVQIEREVPTKKKMGKVILVKKRSSEEIKGEHDGHQADKGTD